MDYLEFARWLKSEQENFALPFDCRELVAPGAINPRLTQWVFRWAIHFTSDNKYARIWEQHDPMPGMIGTSQRVRFAFHYGPLVRFTSSGNPEVDPLGIPVFANTDPVDIRIDTCSRKAGSGRREPHLHYEAPEPHIPQANIQGLVLVDIDMFTFLRSVLRHRQSGEPLQQVLRFRII